MKYGSLFYCLVLLLESISAMRLPVTVFNDTEERVILRNFDLKYSFIDIGPRKIDKGNKLKFNITPIAEKEKESL